MKARLWFLPCLAWGFALLTRADLKVGTYAPDLEADAWLNTDDQRLSLAELRGMVVALFFWGGDNGADAIPIMTRLNQGRFGQEGGVFILAVSDAPPASIADVLKKEKFYLPVGTGARKTYEEYDVKVGPRVTIIDPVGKVAWTGWPGDKGDRGADKLAGELDKIVSDKQPTRTHPELAAKAEAYLKQARQAIRAERYREAYEAAEKAFRLSLRGDPLMKLCEDYGELVEALGRERLAQADRAVESQQYDDAVVLLLEVRREFQGTEVATRTRRKIDALLQKNPEIAKIFAQQESAGRAEIALAGALEDLRNRKFGPAFEKLTEIVGEYSSTPTAAKAQTVLDRMKQNDDIMGHVRDHQAAGPCRTLLFQADSFRGIGRTQKARELYREIIEKYADTIFAEEAARRLAQLP